MHDDTEQTRRALVPQMPAELLARVEQGERVWTTAEFVAEFEMQGFVAPFVVACRRSDGARGSLQFTHMPRYYFGWQEEG